MSATSRELASGATRRLTVFFGVLTGIVGTFSLVAWVMDVSVLTFGPAYMFSPFVAGMFVCYLDDIPLTDVGLRFGRRRWLLISALCWPPLALVIAGVSILVPGVTLDLSMIPAETGVPHEPHWIFLGLVALVGVMIIAGVTINAVLALGEEFGWRGYLLWELAPLGFWKASFLIGAIWGLWHAPLVVAGLNYPSYPIVGVFVFTVVCIAMSPLFTFLVVRGDSVLPAVFLHGVFNATGLVGLAATDRPVLRELVASEGGLVGIGVFTLILLLIWATHPPDLRTAFPGDSVEFGPRSASRRASIKP